MESPKMEKNLSLYGLLFLHASYSFNSSPFKIRPDGSSTESCNVHPVMYKLSERLPWSSVCKSLWKKTFLNVRRFCEDFPPSSVWQTRLPKMCCSISPPYNLTKGSCHLIRRILKCPAPKSAKHQDIDTVINCTLKYIPHPVPVQIQKKCICPVRKSRILLNVQ